MADFFLVPHPAFPPREVAYVNVTVEAGTAGLRLTYAVEGSTAALRLPPPDKPYRADELWRTTCFELFVCEPSGYREYNFSPSSAWAAYRFDTYREGMADLPVDAPPQITVCDEGHALLVSVALDPQPQGATIALSAVIEEVDGRKSYWALTHPDEKPDFHHPDGFVVRLSAA